MLSGFGQKVSPGSPVFEPPTTESSESSNQGSQPVAKADLQPDLFRFKRTRAAADWAIARMFSSFSARAKYQAVFQSQNAKISTARIARGAIISSQTADCIATEPKGWTLALPVMRMQHLCGIHFPQAVQTVWLKLIKRNAGRQKEREDLTFAFGF